VSSLFTCSGIWINKSFRFTERKDNAAGRFVKVVAGVIGKALRYAKLIGKSGGDGLPQKTIS